MHSRCVGLKNAKVLLTHILLVKTKIEQAKSLLYIS